ncbi:MAG: restriction endonuclease [Candidatus Nealsonbacteria bacterium CG10_big_fil_rev_8_21_14_0_10_36_24]|uniref:Restriction endonuclease n=1 Tax=Candidatus Nealsonbacteria bacterium CG10_big_fil_rev_8_21_14_0_10_36_24 TaxID=1974710 RepID=A0A2M6NR83_9BACT|nr:MAG: restriction endonuclease [Candidatus Nealsonbacteria bacterium CG10_big_fil_rev_8_21_14_0_10_36_24]
MNKWIKKSINLANSPGYLDKLFEVYPIESREIRQISAKIKERIKNAFRAKDKLLLVKTLLELPKFPIDDPYIASLRKYPSLLNKNPKTVKRIGKRLLSIKMGTLLELAVQPKSPSRQLGHSFKRWLQTINYPFLDEKEFLNSKDSVVFLKGGDKKLKQFAQSKFKIRIPTGKGPDFILKINNKFFIGESKFLTDYGGSQDNQFNNAIKMLKITKKNVEGIAVLDGIVWFKSGSHMYKTIAKQKGIALSALLLEEFIKEEK